MLLKAVVYQTVCFTLISDIPCSTQVTCDLINCALYITCAVCYNSHICLCSPKHISLYPEVWIGKIFS